MTTIAELMALQKVIHDKFEEVERLNSLLEWIGPAALDADFSLPQLQMKLRRYCWQITEEVAEALEQAWGGNERFEEISDVFHFLLDLCIICQYTPGRQDISLQEYFIDETNQLYKRVDVTREQGWLEFIVSLGRFANHLKNRPWKQAKQVTSSTVVCLRLEIVFGAFVRAAIMEGITCEKLLDSYHRKHAINQGRLESGV